ncbi:MAG TPA: ArsR family transcriptional regulator [Nocardioides sp.]|uniref:ArsR family transcriptional regulator n=1 Tax=Nocardioides sp. TaxID=35761 RepID=UPI002D06BC28|nr:ArsR family transcriptional regulator [Nocardioides sp.]HTW17292.1 ArsR family transcriptional regulator [Nocardioides sp.]
MLLPILRSQLQGEVLALTYLNPDAEYSITELAKLIGASVKSTHHEVSRLVDGGLLLDRRLGTSRMVKAAPDTVLARPLTDLLAVTYGPLPVLTRALATVPGIDLAFIYGSWAARYHGEAGPVPADVDVLVVGTPDRDDLDDQAHEAERILRREVNIRRVRPQAWYESDDPFLSTVRTRPMVPLAIKADGSDQS